MQSILKGFLYSSGLKVLPYGSLRVGESQKKRIFALSR